MPKHLPSSLAEVPPEEPHQPQEVGAEIVEVPTAAPDDVLRVLGGIGLPGDAEVARIDEVVEIEEPIVPPVGPEPRPVTNVIYSEKDGLNTARQKHRSFGSDAALDILVQTERTGATDTLHDDIVLGGAHSKLRSYGSEAAIDYLDANGLRTDIGRQKANELYDQTILAGANAKKRGFGSESALDFVAAHNPRTSGGKTTLDSLYDDTIIAGAQGKRRSFGKDAALDFLTKYIPRTQEGAQRIETLRQQIMDSRR